MILGRSRCKEWNLYESVPARSAYCTASATIFRNCLAVALLLLAACSTRGPNGSSRNPASGVPPLGAHDIVDSGLQPGEYVTEKGWGHLQITREDENLFFSLDSVTGDGACVLTGEFNGDHGIVMEKFDCFYMRHQILESGPRHRGFSSEPGGMQEILRS